MSKRGYSLIETMISSAVVLIVVASLTMSAGYFLQKRNSADTRRDALGLAETAVTDYEVMDSLPADGTYTMECVSDGNSFKVTATIISPSNMVREIRVVVTASSGEQVELVRQKCREAY